MIRLANGDPTDVTEWTSDCDVALRFVWIALAVVASLPLVAAAWRWWSRRLAAWKGIGLLVLAVPVSILASAIVLIGWRMLRPGYCEL
ncbi:MAG: hypothetical protein AAFV96_13775 [Pseudomonadota bacterium]